MTGRYQVRLFDPLSGGQSAIFENWNSLYYNLRLNDTSTHTFSIDGLDARRSLFVTDVMVEVYREDPENGVPLYLEYAGFHRTDQDQTTDRNDNLFTSYGRAYMDLLHRRAILYYAGSVGDTKSGPADDIMKAYVRENAGPLATIANGRIRDGVTPGLSVQASVGLNVPWSGSSSWKNLLEQVQAIALHGSVDFDLVRVGPLAFQFNTYFPRLGVDRSAGGVITSFAPELGNMSAPYATKSRVEEVNDIIVLGTGDGVARTTLEVQDVTTQLDSPWNRVEKAHDARNSPTVAELTDVGQTQINALKASRALAFQVVQSQGSVYHRDYALGDLVLCRYRQLQEQKKIVSVEVTVANGREDIRIHFDDESVAIS